MVAFFKAIPFGILLTLLVSLFMGSGGATGGMLSIFSFDVTITQLGLDFTLYWSWMLFLAGTGLAFFILLMMSD